jgi:hypothetical protein
LAAIVTGAVEVPFTVEPAILAGAPTWRAALLDKPPENVPPTVVVKPGAFADGDEMNVRDDHLDY